MLCSCQPCCTVCLLQLSVFKIRENMTGAAVIWYKIYFVCPLIKEGSKITKQNRKNLSLETHRLYNMLGFCQEQMWQVRNICCARHPCDFRLFRTPWRWGSTSSVSCNYCQPPLTHQHSSSSLSSLSSSRMWRLTDKEWPPRTAEMKYKADVSSNVGWGMLTRGYKTGLARLENRKERIPDTVGG